VFQVKEEISEAKAGKKVPAELPVVYGLATVYSCVFIMIAQYLVLLMILVLGESAAPTAVLLFCSIICFLFLLSYARLESSLMIGMYLSTRNYLPGEKTFHLASKLV